MKPLIFSILLIISSSSFAGFLHPMDFDDSDSQKNKVIAYIKQQVKDDYCNSAVDMCQPSMLRMMEKENLEAFKKATRANNRKIMDRVIKDYCNSAVDMCNYVMIFMMYQENEKAANQSLEW